MKTTTKKGNVKKSKYGFDQGLAHLGVHLLQQLQQQKSSH